MKQLILVCAILAAPCSAMAEDAVGQWRGAIDGHLLSLVHVEKAADGRYAGTFDDHQLPLRDDDNHAVSTHLSQIEASDGRLAFEVPMIGGDFDGQWDSGRQQWIGTFQWGKDGYKSQLALERTQATTLATAFPDPQARTYGSPADETAAMDRLIAGYVKDGRFSGAILVRHDGRVMVDRGYGMADQAGEIANGPDTRFQIGSITKSFTATAILMLQDRGALSIDDSIGRYISDAPAAWDGMTLRHLLTHRSGLGDYHIALAGHLTEPHTPQELVAVVRGLPLAFAPGDGTQYSNAGFILLGAVIERVSGQGYGDFMQAAVFSPLGMTATAVNPVADPKQATGYRPDRDGPKPADRWDLSGNFSSGGMVSTTHDLAAWQAALYGGRLLSPEGLRQMTELGLGIDRSRPGGRWVYSKGGQTNGFISYQGYEPEDRLSVIVLGNLQNDTPSLLGRGLAEVAHGLPVAVVKARKVKSVPVEVLALYVGRYVLTPGLSLVVSLEDGQLMAQATDMSKMPLYAETETVFATPIVGVKLEFVQGADGRVGCVLHQGGRDIAGVRP